MPMPAKVQRADGALVVTPAEGLSRFTVNFDRHDGQRGTSSDQRLLDATHRMLVRLDRKCGGDILRSSAAVPPAAPAVLTISVSGAGEPVQGIDEDESYSLTVTPQSAKLIAATDVGAMHGMETLLQLAGNAGGACVLPAVTIEDSPRFRWRGFMLDTSRHFEPEPVILRQLDAMAVAKLNVFHWHLSDDQGFRAESLVFPRLTGAASDGDFYTQAQMREVVAYAAARGIRVVPEFDMPGHTSSWIVAYPSIGSEKIDALPTVFGIPVAELDPSQEATFKFINKFVGEMSAIFPDQYFHIGGDETEGKGWLANPRVTAFMQKKGFKTPGELQAYFNQRLLPILEKHGKRMVGWDEILAPTLPKDIVVESWRGVDSLAAGAKQGYDGILAAPYYLDAEKTSAQMFLADPIPADTTLSPDEQGRILGGEAAMWAEQINAQSVDSRVWPRTLTVAERLWSPREDRDVPDMYARLRRTSLELSNLGVEHLSGPQAMRDSLAERRDPPALDTLASVLEHTDALTSLDRLVDAVAADPPARQQMAGQVEAVVDSKPQAGTDPKQDRSGDVPQGFPSPRPEAMEALRERFRAWQEAVPGLVALSRSTPRLNDIEPLALELGDLGATGLEALAFLESGRPAPPSWGARARAALENASGSKALVRFAVLVPMKLLVEAAEARR